MKARKLVKDDFTGKQNIVFFGSYGYEVGEGSHEMLLFRQGVESSLVVKPEPELLIDEDLLISGGSNTFYNYFYLNLYFKKGISEQFITITTTSSLRFTWLVQFNALDKNQNVLIQKLGLGQYTAKISIDDLIDEFGQYEIVSNFMIAIIVENSSIPLDEFTINYPTRVSKLAYDKNRFTAQNPYTYLESQQFNYATEQRGVRDALIPRLSVIKGELWYKASYGLPLMDKIKSKGIYDSIIVRYITDYPDVVNLEEFSSTLGNHTYTFDCIINTVYGEKINLSNK